jgi:radical SAM superfamily enzyme YgiQ (UPF0313 family)
VQELYIIPPRIPYLCGALKKAGYTITVLDIPSLGWRLDRILATINSDERKKVVGITTTTLSYPYAEALGQALRALGVFVVMGGEHPSFAYEEVLRNRAADVCVLGEGERTLVALLDRYKDGDWQSVRGIAFSREDRTVVNAPQALIEDLDELGIPDYASLPVERYLARGGKLSLNTMRGCDFRCEFCLIPQVHRDAPRYRSIDAIIEELQYLRKRYAISRFSFTDPTFTLDRERVAALCQRLLREGLDLSWSCTTRMNTLDLELLKLMRASGCETILFGVESLEPRLSEVSAKHSVSVREVLAWCKDCGICFLPSFIMGLPMDDEDSSRRKFQATLDLIQEFDLHHYQFNTIAPFPGTNLNSQAVVQVNRKIPYSFYCIVPAHYTAAFPAQDYLRFWNHVMQTVFPEYYLRYLELEESALSGLDPHLKYFTSGAKVGRPENLTAVDPLFEPVWRQSGDDLIVEPDAAPQMPVAV